MIVAWEAFRAGLMGRKHWLRNVLSGLAVGVVSLPLSMAFAIASGVSPALGINTAIVAGLCVSLFGGSRYQVAGPTGAFVPLLLSVVRQYGLGGLQVATLMAGIMLIIMGWVKVGGLLKYIPTQVIVGFTAGIGVMLFLGQVNAFLGDRNGWPDLSTSAIGAGALLVLVGIRFIPYLRHVPGPLLVLLLGGGLQAIWAFPTVETIGTAFGPISARLPRPYFPGGLEWDSYVTLLAPAIAIAILCAIESLLSAVIADGMAGTRHDSNQELIGHGIGKILSPLFSGIAATGAIARTATNVRAGATSPLSGIICGCTLILLLIFCAPLAQFIPLTVLAAILFVISYHMVDFSYFLHLIRNTSRSDVAVLIVTFILTISCGLVIAVNGGIILSALLLMRRLASSTDIDCSRPSEAVGSLETLIHLPPEISVYTVSGPLFFAMVERLEETLGRVQAEVQTVILRLAKAPFIDTTALANLRRAIRRLEISGKRLLFCEATEKVARSLKRAKIQDSLADDNPQKTLVEAVDLVRIPPSTESQ
jgi:SulP family sulfate permease